MIWPLKLMAVALLPLLLVACDEIPSDPLETTRKVEEAGVVKVGFVSVEEDVDPAQMERFAARVAEAHGVEVEATEGAAGSLLRALESENLDLVIGVFPKASPWAEHAAFTSAFATAEPEKELPVLRGAVHLGENRWLLSIERAIEGA